jgi:hypothetical protein
MKITTLIRTLTTIPMIAPVGKPLLGEGADVEDEGVVV